MPPTKIGARGRNTGSNNSSGYIQTKNGEKKFIGGAAMARRTARSQATRILRPDEKERSTLTIPMSLPSFERFFAGLLRSAASEYLPTQHRQLDTWRRICQRLRLPIPEGHLKATYPDSKQHFYHRAALVMEEARHAIAEGVAKLHKRSQNGNPRHENVSSQKKQKHKHQKYRSQYKDTIVAKLTSVDQRDRSGHTILTFASDQPFTPDQILCLRQGSVLACTSMSMASNVANTLLACVIPASRDDIVKEQRVAMMVFNPHKATPDTTFELTMVASLLTEQRKFAACTSKSTINIPFLTPLLGGKRSTHTVFTEDENGDTMEIIKSKANPHDLEDDENLVPMKLVRKIFEVPILNHTQEKSARSFLNSTANSITLIQGPPGTGKTTLLVSIICRYIMESIEAGKSRSLMVCAPTNKAVSVLCNRFLESIRDKDRFPCNAILLGDDEKLLDDDYSRNSRPGGETSRLRSIFLYTWTQTLLDDFGKINFYIKSKKGRRNGNWAVALSKKLTERMSRSLKLPQTLLDEMTQLCEWLEKDVASNYTQAQKVGLSLVRGIIDVVREWRSDHIWQELLGSAHVIFCTLASAGATILKKSVVEINDLIVDEAAAATEPEMYIPFQFRPERLLAVGDPKQLPATVVSRVAEERGMSRSLHERLMFDCDFKHIMLDVQYRMNPAMSAFPSKQFYDGQLSDGPNVKSEGHQGSVSLLDGQPYAFLQVYGKERQSQHGSIENEAEAQTVVNLIEHLQRTSRRTPGKWNSADRIRVITFYQAQVSLIKRMLYRRRCGDVVVATVDSSQGCEADIVIVSFVRSDNQQGKKSVGFLSDDRRLNVAITRGKTSLQLFRI